MWMTRECDYALVVLVFLAGRQHQRMSCGEIASALNIPSDFLAKILPKLCRAGFVGSKEGAGGGYELAKNPSTITLADVLRATDNPLQLVECAEGEACRCPRHSVCAILESMQTLHRRLTAMFEGMTVADLIPLASATSAARSADDDEEMR